MPANFGRSRSFVAYEPFNHSPIFCNHASRHRMPLYSVGNSSFAIRHKDIIEIRVRPAAPDGWSVIFAPERKKFFVNNGGESVAELDSLALAKILPPDKFFQRYADDINREYQELLALRDQITAPERLKMLDTKNRCSQTLK